MPNIIDNPFDLEEPKAAGSSPMVVDNPFDLEPSRRLIRPDIPERAVAPAPEPLQQEPQAAAQPAPAPAPASVEQRAEQLVQAQPFRPVRDTLKEVLPAWVDQTQKTSVGDQAGYFLMSTLDLVPSMVRGLNQLRRHVVDFEGKAIKKVFGKGPEDLSPEHKKIFDAITLTADDPAWLTKTRDVKTEVAEQLAESSTEHGGKVGRVASEAVNVVYDTVQQLAVLKGIGISYGGGSKTGSKLAQAGSKLLNAQKIAAFNLLTTEADENADISFAQQKADAYLTTVLYMSTPAVSSWMKTKAGAVAVDMALNTLVSIGRKSYGNAWEEGAARANADGRPEDATFEKLLAAAKVFGMDAVFSAMTAPMKAGGAPSGNTEIPRPVQDAIRQTLEARTEEQSTRQAEGYDDLLKQTGRQSVEERAEAIVATEKANNQSQGDSIEVEKQIQKNQRQELESKMAESGDWTAERDAAPVETEETGQKQAQEKPDALEDVNAPWNREVLVQHVMESEGQSRADAEQTVAKMRKSVKEKLVADINGFDPLQDSERSKPQPSTTKPLSPATPNTPVADSSPATKGEQAAPKATGEPVNAPVAPKISATEKAETAELPAGSSLDTVPVTRVPVKSLRLSEDVPNFKEDADPRTGVVDGQRLQGHYRELGTAPLVVWERANGNLEVISGRHRLDLARRTNKSNVPVQIMREADGFSAIDARMLDSELNIRDGQGKVKDYANYFRTSEIDQATADQSGLRSRIAGKQGYSLGRLSEDNLYTAYRNGQIAETKAVAIAESAPNNDALQRVGLEYVAHNKGASAEEVRQYLNAVQVMAGPRANVEALDLFGNSDSALNDARSMAKAAVSIQKDLIAERQILKSARKVSKLTGDKAAILKQYGVKPGDVDAINAKLDELEGSIDSWNHWATDKQKVDQVRGAAGIVEAKPAPVAPKDPAPAKPEATDKNSIEYITQSVFKGKTPKAAINAFVKKFKGKDNVFLGDTSKLNAESLMADYVSDKAATAIKQAMGYKNHTGHLALKSTADKFKINEKVLTDAVREQLKGKGDGNGILSKVEESPVKAAKQETIYAHGDKAVLTGKTEVNAGVTWEEYKWTEGNKKGKTGVRMIEADRDAMQAQHEADRKEEQEGAARLHKNPAKQVDLLGEEIKEPVKHEPRKPKAKPDGKQEEMFGKGAVGDAYRLKQAEARAPESISERQDREAREKAAKEATPDTLLEEEKPAQDIEKQGEQGKKGGYITIPDRKGAKRVVRQITQALKREFTRMRGMDAETYATSLQRKHSKESAVVSGQATKTAFKAARRALIHKFDRPTVQEAMQDVVYGEKTIEEFSAEFGINKNHIMVKALEKFHNTRTENSKEIARLLSEQGANPELVQKVLDNDFYISRFYMKHLLGDQFVPDKADYDAATMEIRAGIEDAIEGLTESANKLTGKTEKTFADPVRFMQTRNTALIEHLSASRQKALIGLANKFDKLNQVIESVVYDENGNVKITTSTESMLDAAQSTVDFFLNRQESGPGAIDTTHMKKRFLQGAFRALYQEVTDPLFSASSTIEAQEQIIANMTMFNMLASRGEGKAWTAMPSAKAGTDQQLGKAENVADRMRYGKLAGKFVSKELHDAIIGGGTPNKIIANLWYKPMGIMRGLKLLGPKTIARNYVEAYVGFGIGSGDALRKGYGKNYAKSSRLMRDIMLGKARAKEQLAGLVKNGVFSMRGSTQAEEVLNLLNKDPKNWIGNKFQKTMEAYSLIDFPTKVASYWSALERGMTDKEAIEHVRRLYQNPDSVPQIAATVSKLGLSDYSGYFIDSMRIRVNQVKYAFESAKKGDMVPTVGLTLSSSADLARRGALTLLWKEGLTAAWSTVQQAFRDDDDEIEDVAPVDESREIALREFMPDWYQDAPIMTWQETMKDGSKVVYYSAVGGNSAFPIDDMIYGAIQAEENNLNVPLSVVKNVFRERTRPGMYPAALYKFFTGDSLGGDYKSTGIQDVMFGSHPRKSEIMLESTLNLGMDIFGGQIGPKVQQTRAIKRKQKGEIEPRAGTYTPYRDVKQVWTSLANPTRTYGINKDEATRLIRNKLFDYKDGLQASKGMVSYREKMLKNSGASTEYLDNASEKGQAYRKKYLNQAEGVVVNARAAFGDMISDKELAAILRDGMGMSVIEAKAVVGGKVDELKEYKPTPRKTALERANSSSHKKTPSYRAQW